MAGRRDAALEREFEQRLTESSTPAFRVALAVLRQREEAGVAQDVALRDCQNFPRLRSDVRLPGEHKPAENIWARLVSGPFARISDFKSESSGYGQGWNGLTGLQRSSWSKSRELRFSRMAASVARPIMTPPRMIIPAREMSSSSSLAAAGA